MRRSVFLSALFVYLFASVRVEASKPVVAVFEIKNEAKLSRNEVRQLTDLVATQLTASGLYQVVPNSELKNALRQKKAESYKSCYDEACQIEIGKEIAAEKTLATKVSKLGKTCIITMQLYDLRRSASEKAASKTGKCGVDNILELLQAAMKSLTDNGNTALTGQRTSGTAVTKKAAPQIAHTSRNSQAPSSSRGVALNRRGSMDADSGALPKFGQDQTPSKGMTDLISKLDALPRLKDDLHDSKHVTALRSSTYRKPVVFELTFSSWSKEPQFKDMKGLIAMGSLTRRWEWKSKDCIIESTLVAAQKMSVRHRGQELPQKITDPEEVVTKLHLRNIDLSSLRSVPLLDTLGELVGKALKGFKMDSARVMPAGMRGIVVKGLAGKQLKSGGVKSGSAAGADFNQYVFSLDPNADANKAMAHLKAIVRSCQRN